MAALRTRGQVGLAAAGLLGIGVVVVAYSLGSSSTDAPSAPAAAPAPRSVETIRPQRRDLARTVDTNATLEAYETADLYPKLSGYLSEVRVDIGDRVRAGEVLAVISVPETEKELAEAEAVLAAKRADLAFQRVTLERQEKLLRAFGTSQQLVDDARAKSGVAAAEVDLAAATVEKIRTLLEYRTIVAPFDGVIAQRQVNRGDFMQSASSGRSTPLFTVQRIDMIRVFCNVPETEVSRLMVGQRVRVEPFALAGQAFEGMVARFANRLDPETRTMRTEIDLPNPNGALYPGMYARVSLETERHRDVLTLPSTAVLRDGNGQFVYAVSEGRIARVPIMIGIVAGAVTEVSGELSEAAEIVAVGQTAPAPGTIVGTVSRSAS